MNRDDIDSLLKSAWLRQLREDWRSANYSFFKNKMRLPQMALSPARQVLGRWKGGIERSLTISATLIQSAPWDYVQEVLYHEMVHQYVEEILGLAEGPPHGAAFKHVCLDHGIDGSATGDLQTWVENRRESAQVQSAHHKTIDKVNKLLALAGSANAHEAESAMSKAHTLLLKHNLSLLDLQQVSGYQHKQIGEVGRRNPAKSLIAAILSRFFFVETIWAFAYDAHRDQRGYRLELYGTAENIAIAEYIYATLHSLSERLWQDYKRQEAMPGDRHRRSFIYGLLNGFYEQLDNRRVANESKNLIWTGDPRLQEFFRKRNPKRVRVASRYAKSSKSAYLSGIAQGLRLVIHKGLQGKRTGAIQSLT